MEELVLTSEEAINLTIENGFDGSEFNLELWRTKKRIPKDRSLDGLVDKLKTIYNSVEVRGRGKNREFVLSGKKEVQTERVHGNKGKEIIENKILKEYIFNKLVSIESKGNLIYRRWADLCGIKDLLLKNDEELLTYLTSFNEQFPGYININFIHRRMKEIFKKRQVDVIELVFDRLVSEKRIKITPHYMAKSTIPEEEEEEIDGFIYGTTTHITLSESEYELIHNEVKDILSKNNMSYFKYMSRKNNGKKSDPVVNEIKEMLYEKYKIKYYYTTYHVQVLDKTIQQDVSEEEMLVAYCKRFLDTSKINENTYMKKGKVSFFERHYYNNIYSMLKYSLENTFKNNNKLKDLFNDGEYVMKVKSHKFNITSKEMDDLFG